MARKPRAREYKATGWRWTPEHWDAGHVCKGRMLVYRPDCPRAYTNGWALRAHVVWWLAHGECHPRELRLHHVNEDRLDDRLENLAPLTQGEHLREHRPTGFVAVRCAHCGAIKEKPAHRLRYARNFCSYACYVAHPKTDTSRDKQSLSLRRAYAEGRR